MVNKALVNYIKEQTKNGYDAQIIRGHLLKYGYLPSDVDEAINQILFDPHTRSVLAKGRQQFLKEVLSYPGQSVNQVLKVINDMLQNNA